MSSNSNLDVKLLSFGRVGTVAVGRALMRHPDLLVPSWNDADALFDEAQPLPATELKRCLTLHQHDLLMTERIKALAYIESLTAAKAVHMVRDPVKHVVGWFNYLTSCAALDSSGWHSPGSFDEFLSGKYPVFATLFSEQLAQRFYPQVDDVMLVDFPELGEATFGETINRIFNFIGVPEQPVEFVNVQNDLTVQFMERGFNLNLNGETVGFSLVQHSGASDRFLQDHFMVIEDLGAVMRQCCPSLRAVEGRSFIGFKIGTELQKATYDFIVQNKEQIFPQVIEGWAKNAERMTQQIRERQVTGLSSAQQDVLWRLLGDDIRQFTKRYPQLKDSWVLS